ncbi:MAG: hypothetical protein DME32_09930 [Verrucomicrobia bacterium]|nr:MAG: hypothetical protein DME32_09930 [Verrucomicrobiota bacterium]
MRKSCLLSLVLTILASTRMASADPVSELSGFSIFDKVDLAQLAKSDGKTAHGPPMSNPRFLSVQSIYVLPGAPAPHLEAMRNWNPSEHHEPKVFLHGDISGAISESTFARIKGAPDNGPVRALVNATAKMGNELQLSREEAARWKGGNAALSAAGGDFWMSVLAGRGRAFISGGTSAEAPYDHAGPAVRAGEELNGLLREQSKIRKQFAGVLDNTGIGRGAGSLKPDLYWELLNADNVAVATLGAFYSRNAEGAVQAADTFYYSSGGYYVTLTLHQMWPVEIDGKPHTLVWRGDMVSSAALADLHGVEKLGSESAMMKDIAKSIARFRKERAR